MPEVDVQSRKRRQQRRAKKPVRDATKGRPAPRRPEGEVEVVGKRLTKSEARSLTDKVKADAAALWRELKELHEGVAHEVLGYGSWGAYVEAEFGFSRVHGYRLVKAAGMLDVLGSNPGVTERHLRELVPLAQTPKELQAFGKEQFPVGEKPPSVAQLHEAVQARLSNSRKTKPIGVKVVADDAKVDEIVAAEDTGDMLDALNARTKIDPRIINVVCKLVDSVGNERALELFESLLVEQHE